MVAAVAGPTPLHLRPATDLAERVLLPGDPHRALVVAQALLEKPLMFNHARGLWGYTGLAPDGEPLTVQSTGMGGPSAAIVIQELVSLGARSFVRIGTCGALVGGFELGQLVAARGVLSADGTSAVLSGSDLLTPDADLTASLEGAGAAGVTAVSTDLFYDDREDLAADWVRRGVEVVEMEAATLLAIAAREGLEAAVVLAVTDLLDGGERRRIDSEALEAVGIRLGDAAFAAVRLPSRRP